MKIAIIGAGIAGLSCALEFEKYGIQATIYEKNSYIGEQYQHVGACLKIAARSIGDPLSYLKNKFGLEIKPITKISSIIHYSPNKTTEIKGDHGYFLNRSIDREDIKVQIYSKLKNPKILFNTYGNYEELSKKNDYVIVADGQNSIPNELGCWSDWVNTQVKCAVIVGDFNPNTLKIWINKLYCKNGYAYLTPFNNKKASLVLVVTDIPTNEIDQYWELFWSIENLKYSIIEEVNLTHNSGHVYPSKIDNILFIGNSVGAIDPFLGFGVLSSVITGIMAAQSILENKDYDKLICNTLKVNFQLFQFRIALNNVKNKDYDKMITSIGLPIIKQLLYDSPIDFIKFGSKTLKLLSRLANK